MKLYNPSMNIVRECAIFAACSLLVVAQPVRGQDAADSQEVETATPLNRSYMRGWRLAIGHVPDEDTERERADKLDLASDRAATFEDADDESDQAAGQGAEDEFVDEFDLASEQVAPVALGYAFDRFWALDVMCGFGRCGRGRAFAYTIAGERDPDADFDLEADVGWGSMTAVDGLMYMVGVSREPETHVFAYTSTGKRTLEAEFKLLPDHNYNPQGIVHVDGRFYVLDAGQDERRRAKVYAYAKTGEHIPSADFDLGLRTADFARQIAYADGHFYVVALMDGQADPAYIEQVRKYRPNGELVASLPFRQTFLEGIAVANDLFYVLGHFRVCAYTFAGERVSIERPTSALRRCDR